MVIAANKMVVEDELNILDQKIGQLERRITSSWRSLAKDGACKKVINRTLKGDFDHLEELYEVLGKYESATVKIVPHARGLRMIG